MQRIERLRPANCDELHVVNVVDQHVARVRIGGRRRGSGNPARLDRGADALDLLVAHTAHQLERPGLEAEREAAAKLQVFARSDVSIKNVAGLRDQDAEQPIANGRRRIGIDRRGLAGRNRAPGLDRVEHRRRAIVLALLVSLQRIGLDDDRVAVREIEHEERPGMDEFGGDRVDLGGAGAIEQVSRLVAPVVEHAVEHEAGHVGGGERHLAGLAEDPAQVVESPGSSSGARITSTIGLRQAGAKKCVTVARSCGATRKDPLRRQRTGVRRDQRFGPHQLFQPGEDPALERKVLGRGLDRPIGLTRHLVVERGVHVAAHRIGLTLAHLAAGNRLLGVLRKALHGAIERRLGDVQEIERQVRNGRRR